MKTIKTLQAIRKRVKVSRGRCVEIDGLPFQPGSEVEVIVIGKEERPQGVKGEDIYAYAESLKKQKDIPRYTLKEIERIIHQSRGLSD